MAIQPFQLTPIEITISGTAVALDTGDVSDRFVTSVSVQADKGNTGDIAVGGVNVTMANGIELGPGDVIEFSTENARVGSEELRLSDVFINSATAGNKARVIAFRRIP